MEHQTWRRQAESVLQATSTTTLDTAGCTELLTKHTKLQALDEFVEQRTKTINSAGSRKKTKRSAVASSNAAQAGVAAGGESDDGDESEESADKEPGSDDSDEPDDDEDDDQAADDDDIPAVPFVTPKKSGGSTGAPTHKATSASPAAPASSPGGSAAPTDADDSQLTGNVGARAHSTLPLGAGEATLV